MARISASRTMAADPTSAALLLAGPTALTTAPRGDLRITHQVPWRTPTAFVTRLTLAGPDGPDAFEASGLLTLGYQPAGGLYARTVATLRLEWAPSPDEVTATTALAMRRTAEEILEALAAAAESRALAA